MTTHEFVILWQAAAVASTFAVIWIIASAPRERRPMYWAIALAWILACYAWDITINFTGHVEYSDHWWMAFRLFGKAEPALAPFIYILWFILPAVVLLEHRDRLERALGRHHLSWILLAGVLWSFYLDFAATSFRPVWTYYQRKPFIMEYPMTAPFVNGALTLGAFLIFRAIDDRRRAGRLRFGGLALRTTLATNATYAGVFLMVFLLQRVPFLQSTMLDYVKSQ